MDVKEASLAEAQHSVVNERNGVDRVGLTVGFPVLARTYHLTEDGVAAGKLIPKPGKQSFCIKRG